MPLEGDHIVGGGTEARAGETGHNVRTVLIVGTALCAVSFVVVYLFFFA